MPIQGLRHTGNFEANQRPQNWREAILYLNPNGMAPLTGLTSQMAERGTDDPQFSWFEKVLQTQRFALTANLGTTGDLVVASGALTLKAGHIIRIEHSGEIVRVPTDPVVDTIIPVQRGFSGTTAATVLFASQNPNVHVIGTAHEEGSAAPTGINYEPVRRFNYTQIFRNTLEMTRTASKTRLRTGDGVKEAKRECLELHSIEMEKAFFWGRAFETTLAGKPIRTTGGVISYIPVGNVVNNADGTFNMLELEGWLKRIFDFGSTEKMAFLGNQALAAINQCVRRNSSYNIQSGVKEYGMSVTRMICPFGELMLKTHPLFNQITDATYNTADTSMTVLDMKNIRYVSLEGSDTKYQQDLAENGLDGMKSGYITECGLEVNHPLTHFQINGLRTGIIDT
jgi:hypothetical protein